MTDSNPPRADPDAVSPIVPGAEALAGTTRWTRLLTSPRGRGIRAMASPLFRRLLMALLVGQLGFWVSLISMQVLMARLTDSDPHWLGLLFFTNFIPMLVFTPFAGLLADRIDRKLILIGEFVAIVAIMGTLGGLHLAELVTPPLLLPFAFAIGSVFAFSSPATMAIIASSVPPQDLSSAISLESAASNLSRVVGPLVAAPIIVLAGEAAAFIIYAAASLIQIAILARLHVPPYEPEPTGPFLQRLKGGLVHARERPPMAAALAVVGLCSLFGGAYLALLPVVADRTFGRGPEGFTTMAAVAGLGSMIGALAMGSRESNPTLRSGALLTAAFGVTLVLFGLTDNWALALVLLALSGAAYFAAMTALTTLVQMLSDDSKRGRVMALFTIVWGGLVPIGSLWQGEVATGLGASRTLALAGGLTVLFALGITVTPRRRSVTAA